MRRILLNPLLYAAFATAGLLCGCQAVDVLNAVIPKGGFTKTADVAYGALPRQALDVYVPKAPPRTRAGYPVVVFFYGGSWQNGNRADYLFVAQALTSKGYIAILPDYRTYPATIFPGFMNDAAKAVRWAEDHAAQYGGDTSQLFLMGHSAGAQIAVLLATDDSYLQKAGVKPASIRGVIGLAGPYDFLPLQDDTLKQVFPLSERAASQPINFVTRHEPPMFLAAGTADKTVDPGNTTRMSARLRAAGDEVVTHAYPGLTHVSLVAKLAAPFRRGSSVLNDIAQFIDMH